ncbi:MAG: methyltransferase domain-containing protein [Verrucomicrobiota bacterium]
MPRFFKNPAWWWLTVASVLLGAAMGLFLAGTQDPPLTAPLSPTRFSILTALGWTLLLFGQRWLKPAPPLSLFLVFLSASVGMLCWLVLRIYAGSAFPNFALCVSFSILAGFTFQRPTTKVIIFASSLFVSLLSTLFFFYGTDYLPHLLAALGGGATTAAFFTRPIKTVDTLAFDAMPGYRKYELLLARFHRAREVINDLLKKRPRVRVLDLNCGNGEMKKFCKASNIELFGQGENPDSMDWCRNIGYAAAIEHPAAEVPFPYPDHYFDVVCTVTDLGTTGLRPEVLKEFERIVRRDGLILLTVRTSFPPSAWWRSIKRVVFRLPADQQQPSAPTAHALKAHLETILPAYRLQDLRGFRLFSARRLLPFEDWKWFFRLSSWYGRQFPHWVPEVSVVLVRSDVEAVMDKKTSLALPLKETGLGMPLEAVSSPARS